MKDIVEDFLIEYEVNEAKDDAHWNLYRIPTGYNEMDDDIEFTTKGVF